MTMTRKWQVLAGLVALWVALIVVRVITAPEPKEVPLKFTSGQLAARSGHGGQAANEFDIKPITIAARQIPGEPKKNIFAPWSEPQSPEQVAARAKARRKSMASAPLAPPVAAAPPVPPPSSPEELAAQAARQQEELRLRQLKEQMAQYRYLGFLTRDGDRKAFLGKGRELYVIRLGDKLEGKFLVAAIDSETVKLRETQSSLEATLQLKKEDRSGPS